ncbi:hypothetical protein AB0A74_36000 [Saccharothrix sp. NPDC042600]|uniref:hypothetical protein n=1 Tax=Saccharothrix TaxID=2071 RepID=UPI0033E8CE19|nr:hypothetical protein GCM10017745_82280 [Saccharothrix mutabilis subsp. capreolus]
MLLAADDCDIVTDYRMFGLVDGSSRALPAPPGKAGLSVGETAVFLGTEDDVVRARLRVEFWAGPAPFDGRDWPRVEDVTLSLPSGRLVIDQNTAGATTLAVPGGPGRYRVRLAWRELPWDAVGEGEPEALGLAQLWPVAATSGTG